MSWTKRFNPLAPRPRGPSAVGQVKDWIRELLAIEDDAVIAVSELACREPGCPDLETVIAIFRVKQPAQMFRVAKPLAAVTRPDVETAVRAARPNEDLEPAPHK